MFSFYNSVNNSCKGENCMRKHYLDNIRWLVGVLVVIYHLFYMYNAQGISGGLGPITDQKTQFFDLFIYIVYPWLMPILFIVSGISSRYYLENHSNKEFIRNRTGKLLVPSTIGLFVFHFIQGYVSMRLTGGWQDIQSLPLFIKYLIMVLSGIGVLWYMQMLWLLCIILVLIRKIEKDRLWSIGTEVNLPILFLAVFVIWLFAQIGNTPVIVVYRFGLYGIMFFLGYFIFSHEEVIEQLKKTWFIFAAASAVLCVFFCVTYFGKNIADVPINRSFLFTAYCWFGSLAILGASARYLDFENRFTRWMNRHSFGLYVFHYLGISSVALLLGKKRLLPAGWIYLISLIAGFGSGYLLDAAISRIPFMRWAILGKSGGNRNV